MTRYTNCHGKITILCDQCRQDLPYGDRVYSLAYSKVGDGYVSQDYDQSEIVLCMECANKVSQVLALTGARYADSLIMQEAA